jgi:hypothetical protein
LFVVQKLEEMNRAKTDFDPLSFFAHESEHKPEEPEEEEEEPVIPQKKTVNVKPVEYSNYNSSETARPGIVKEAPSNSVSKSADSNTKQTQPHQRVKEAPPVDVLFSDEYNRKTELLLSTEEDLFKSEENSPNPTKKDDIIPSSTKLSKPKQLSSGNMIDYRKTDDDDISDLRVAKLLEKEEGLDESIFGSSTVNSIQQNKIIQKKKLASANNELENESNFLKELDEITIGSKPKYTSTLSKSGDSYASNSSMNNKPSSTSNLPEKKVNIDLDSLDINSYINQQASSSGGGLFDD